jgi:hypothetical protein
VSTPEQRERLLEYLLVLRDELRLQAWDINVVEAPAPKDDTALDVLPDPRLLWARVRIGSYFEPDGPKIVNNLREQRRIAIHEILHLPQANLLALIHDGDWKTMLAPDVADLVANRMMDELEQITETYARMLEPHLPPPPWASVNGED